MTGTWIKGKFFKKILLWKDGKINENFKNKNYRQIQRRYS